jgi:protein TonB
MKYFICSFFALSLICMLHAQEPSKAPGKITTIPDKITPADSTGDDEVFLVVENQPEFPGGLDSLMSYLYKNTHYPEAASKAHIKRTVYMAFIVETDGSISTVKIARGIGYGCDEEAVRVVQAMPTWKPAMNHGKVVRFLITLPVRFPPENPGN